MNLDELKQSVDLIDYAISSGYKVKRVGRDTFRLDPCPVCESYGHFTIYRSTNSYSTFNGCCRNGSIIDFFMEVENLSQKEAIKKLKRNWGK